MGVIDFFYVKDKVWQPGDYKCRDESIRWPVCAQTWNADTHCANGWDTRADTDLEPGDRTVAEAIAEFQVWARDQGYGAQVGRVDGAMGGNTWALIESPPNAVIERAAQALTDILLLSGWSYPEEALQPYRMCGDYGSIDGGGDDDGGWVDIPPVVIPDEHVPPDDGGEGDCEPGYRRRRNPATGRLGPCVPAGNGGGNGAVGPGDLVVCKPGERRAVDPATGRPVGPCLPGRTKGKEGGGGMLLLAAAAFAFVVMKK